MLNSIAETVAKEIIAAVDALGLRPQPTEGGGAGFSEETLLNIYDRMPQEVKDFLRAHWGERTWREYEADMERIRGGS